MKKITWKNETRKIKDLIPWDKNPRRITDKQAEELKKSLDKFNLADPLIVNTDGVLIGGHMRLKIMAALKDKNRVVDVRIPSRKLTEKEMSELNIRLNKNQADWDFEALSKFDRGFLKDIGFEDFELGIIPENLRADLPEVDVKGAVGDNVGDYTVLVFGTINEVKEFKEIVGFTGRTVNIEQLREKMDELYKAYKK